MTEDEKKDKNTADAAVTGSGGSKKTTTAKCEDAAKTAHSASKRSAASDKKNRKDDFSIVLPLKHHHFTPDQYLALQPAATSSSATTSSLPLFIYGSLLIPHILHSATNFHTPVVDLVRNTTAGILRGYRRHAIRNASFPAIIPNKDSLVAGALVLGLNEKEKQSVESFEGGMYDLVEVDVEIEMVVGEMPEGWLLKTEIVRAETYVWNYSEPCEVVPVEEREWSIAPLVRRAWLRFGNED